MTYSFFKKPFLGTTFGKVIFNLLGVTVILLYSPNILKRCLMSFSLNCNGMLLTRILEVDGRLVLDDPERGNEPRDVKELVPMLPKLLAVGFAFKSFSNEDKVGNISF